MAMTNNVRSVRLSLLVGGALICLTLSGCASRGPELSSEYTYSTLRLESLTERTSKRWRGLVEQQRAGKPVDANEALDVGSALYASMRAAGLLAADAGLGRHSPSQETRDTIEEANRAFAQLQTRDAGRR